MAQDNLTALVDAIDRQDDAAAKAHLVALGNEILDLFTRAVAAVEAIAKTVSDA